MLKLTHLLLVVNLLNPVTQLQQPVTSSAVFATNNSVQQGTAVRCVSANGTPAFACGVPNLWQASHAYIKRITITDSNGNEQMVTTAGSSGATPPVWSQVVGGSTGDGGVVWMNEGPTPVTGVGPNPPFVNIQPGTMVELIADVACGAGMSCSLNANNLGMLGIRVNDGTTTPAAATFPAGIHILVADSVTGNMIWRLVL